MAAPRKYPDEYRETVLHLVIEENRTIAETCRLLAAGYQDLEPLQLNDKTAGDWVKAAQVEDRPDLSTLELPEILNTTARGLFDLVNADIYRMKRQKGQADPEALLTLARTLKELQPLTAQRPRNGKGNQQDTGLLGGMDQAATHEAHSNNAPTAIRPVTAVTARVAS